MTAVTPASASLGLSAVPGWGLGRLQGGQGRSETWACPLGTKRGGEAGLWWGFSRGP